MVRESEMWATLKRSWIAWAVLWAGMLGDGLDAAVVMLIGCVEEQHRCVKA